MTEKVWESESTDASDIEEPKAKVAPKPKEPTKAPAEVSNHTHTLLARSIVTSQMVYDIVMLT